MTLPKTFRILVFLLRVSRHFAMLGRNFRTVIKCYDSRLADDLRVDTFDVLWVIFECVLNDN